MRQQHASQARLISRCCAGSGRSSQAVQALQALPPQQQLLLCALLTLRSQQGDSLPYTPSKTPLKATPVKGPSNKPAGLPRASSSMPVRSCRSLATQLMASCSQQNAY